MGGHFGSTGNLLYKYFHYVLLCLGKSWFEAKLDEQDSVQEPRHYGWTIWSASLKIPDDVHDVEIWSKAVDSSYNVQPESFENIWNLRGLLSNAYFKLKIGIHHSD